MKHLKKSELNKMISNQKTTSTELLRHLRAIYNASNISLKSTNNNLYEIIVNGEITNCKSTIKYYVIKLT